MGSKPSWVRRESGSSTRQSGSAATVIPLAVKIVSGIAVPSARSFGHRIRALISYLQRTLHLSRSLGARAQAHVGVPDGGTGYPEIGVVESVEHLDGDLQAESFLEGEPLLDRQILVHVPGSPQIGKVARSSAEGVVCRCFKGCRVEEAVFRSHRDGGNPIGAAAITALKWLSSQIGVLISAIYAGGVSAGAD